MTFASRSLPPEPADPPPGRLQLLTWERQQLIAQVRPRVRSQRQERIRRRIAEITRQILTMLMGETP